MRPEQLILKPRQIRAAQKREGMSLTALAKKCAVSRSTMYRYIDKPGTMPVSVWATVVRELDLYNGKP